MSTSPRTTNHRTTNYRDTFIAVAPDCPVDVALAPPERAGAPTVAELQLRMLLEAPYAMTSDELLFAVHADRGGIAEGDREAERLRWLAKDQACLRSSPLGKRYGWGIHHDAQGRVAAVPLGGDDYARLAADASLRQVQAMRSRRG